MIQVYPPCACGLLGQIQEFRERIYSRDGVSISETHWMDAGSWHIVATDDGGIIGCLRYTPLSAALAVAGGWAVSGNRHALAVKLVAVGLKLAGERGDRVMAVATERHGSASILEKMGGAVVGRYEDSTYGCWMRLLLFDLTERSNRAFRPGETGAEGTDVSSGRPTPQMGARDAVPRAAVKITR
jgi:hypothetical protein